MLNHILDQSSHLLLLGIAMFMLIAASSRKNRFLSVIAVILLAIELFRSHFIASTSSIMHYGFDLVLLSAIALFPFPKKFLERILFVIFGLAAFIGLHSILPTKIPSVFLSKMNSEYNETLRLDQAGEILIRFENRNVIEGWIKKNKTKLDITYPAFTPKDPSFNLDEYAVINIAQGSDHVAHLNQLLSDPLIVYAEFNEVYELKLPSVLPFKNKKKNSTINDPDIDKQWAADKYDISKFHDKFSQKAHNQKDRQATIAILDTGVDANHEDLKDNYLSTSKRYDVDSKGHGTHCAGIAAAVTGNKIGIASWVPAGLNIKVTSIKVLGRFGVGSQRQIINGILEAADKGYDVISMSLGGPSNEQREEAYNEAVAYANSKGSIVVIAAGNSSIDAIKFSPANTDNVIAVSAVDTLFKRADFSNHTHSLKYGIGAPGTNIYSTLPKSKYGPQTGTSMAAPFVSGIIGLMKFYKKDLTTDEAFQIILQSSIQSDGVQIIDPLEALDLFFKKYDEEPI